MYIEQSGLAGSVRAVVAIPARNEARHLPAALAALAKQRMRSCAVSCAPLFEVVVFANDCADGTAEGARALAPMLPFRLHVVEGALAAGEANAGEARRTAMDLGLARLEALAPPRGVILTTDADSRVGADWIDGNLAAIDAGADAVLGRLALDESGRDLPEALHRRGALESEYEALLTELSATLDPVPHNPWPHHSTISGASVAVTVEAYRRVGGLPRVTLGEDKALIAALLRRDARIRFDDTIEVVTSARTLGRAVGGVADTLRLRAACPDAFCDEALEPHDAAEMRAGLRGRLRRRWADKGAPSASVLADDLALSASEARSMANETAFGAAWAIAEEVSPLLRRRLLRPSDLPREIAALRKRLSRLKPRRLLLPVAAEDFGPAFPSPDQIPIDPRFVRFVDAVTGRDAKA